MRDVASGRAETLTYDKLVLSPGAKPLMPPSPASPADSSRFLLDDDRAGGEGA